MAYRDIARPADLQSFTTTDKWLAWADGEGLLPSVAPVVDPACRLCYGAVGELAEGGYFPRCPRCRNYGGNVDAVIPIVYSLPEGLESLLHQYKDWGQQYRWMALPLASIVRRFVKGHLGCITAQFGAPARVATVPSNTARPFDHLRYAVERVKTWPVEWDFGLMVKVKEGRPDRGECNRSFYGLRPGASVQGEVVMLFDDTWTSGASVASVAGCLKAKGASRVLALTVGRQLHAGWGSGDQLIATARSRGYGDRCVLCA